MPPNALAARSENRDGHMPVLDRPFHFAIVVWGETFRDYFLEYCLPSLLAPGNIPALSTRTRSKFLIATLPEDWAAMKATPIFALMERYVEPVYLEIPPCPPDRPGAEHMGVGHKLACDLAFREKAYAVHLTPDCMLSDGTVARLQDLARNGTELVLSAAIRFGEEPFLAHLKHLGVIPRVSRRDTATPISITGRQMAAAAINGMHSETASYEWDTPYFYPMPSAAWWRVPGEDGIVVHTLSWAMLLFDYGAIETHDASTLDDWTLDGDYLFKNLGHSKAIHLVLDSDEAFQGSWAPLDDRPRKLTPQLLQRNRLLGDMTKGAQFRDAFYSGAFDALKQRNFFHAVRWHARPLNAHWTLVEQRALTTLLRYVRPPPDMISPAVAASATPLSLFDRIILPPLLALLGAFLRVVRVIHGLAINRAAILRRISQMLRGDRQAWARVAWRVRVTLDQLMGRAVRGFGPDAPRK